MHETLSILEQRLALLMAMPTYSDNALALRQAIATIGEELEQLGMYLNYTEGDHPALVATTRQTKEPRILLCAHLDVVPVSRGAAYELRVDGSKLKGRGVWDMKFAVASFLELVHVLAEEGSLAKYDLGLMLTTDEEVGGYVLDGLLCDGWRADLTIIPDGGEDWKIESAAKGIMHSRFIAHGRSAHGSRPWEGDNALERLLRASHKLLARYPNHDQQALTVTINQLSAGKAINQIADYGEMSMDARAFTLAELDDLRKFYRLLADKYHLEYHEDVLGYPMHFDTQNSLAQAFISELEAFTGKPVTYAQSFAATDGRWFAQHNLATLMIRPRGGDIHGPDEWLQREDLPRFAALIERFARKHAV